MRTPQDPALQRALAAELKARRTALALSQDALAFASDLNRTFIAKLELASTSPSLTSWLRLATGLQTDPVELLDAVIKRYRRELRVKA